MPGFDTEPFIGDLRRVVAATWSEVTGVYDAEHVDQIDWLDLVLPYAVILIPGLPSADWGLNVLAFQPTIDIYYVAGTRGKSVSLRGKLNGLANAFWPVNPLTTARPLGIGDLSWGDELRPNQLFADANRAQRAGCVGIECLLGVRRT